MFTLSIDRTRNVAICDVRTPLEMVIKGTPYSLGLKVREYSCYAREVQIRQSFLMADWEELRQWWSWQISQQNPVIPYVMHLSWENFSPHINFF